MGSYLSNINGELPQHVAELSEVFPLLGKVRYQSGNPKPKQPDPDMVYILNEMGIPEPTEYIRCSTPTIAAYNSIKKFSSVAPLHIDERRWTKVWNWMSRLYTPYLGNSQILTNDEVSTKVDNTGAAGFPWCMKYLSKKEFYEAEQKLIDDYWEKGHKLGYQMFTQVLLKGELRERLKVLNNQLRTISPVCARHAHRGQRLFHDMNKRWCNANLTLLTALGWRPFGGGTHFLAKMWAQHTKGCSIDLKACDSKLFERFCMTVADFRYSMLAKEFKTHDMLHRIRHHYMEMMKTPLVMPDGYVFQKGIFGSGGNLTGQTCTAHDNELFSKFLVLWAWAEDPNHTFEQYLEQICNISNADDITWTQEDPVEINFSPRIFAWVCYRDFGVVTESLDWDLSPWYDLNFLSFKLEYDPIYQMFFHSPDTVRILCSLIYSPGNRWPPRELARVCNLRVATFGNQTLREILDLVYWKYIALYDERFRLDPEWVRSKRSYHSLRLLGILYSGEEMGNSLSSPLIQSEILVKESSQVSTNFSNQSLLHKDPPRSFLPTTQRLKSALKAAKNTAASTVFEVAGKLEPAIPSFIKDPISNSIGNNWVKNSNKANGWVESKGPKRKSNSGQPRWYNTKGPQRESPGEEIILLSAPELTVANTEHNKMSGKGTPRRKKNSQKPRPRKQSRQGSRGKPKVKRRVSFNGGRPRGHKPKSKKKGGPNLGFGYTPGKTPKPRRPAGNPPVPFSDNIPVPPLTGIDASASQQSGDAQITAGLNANGQGVCVAIIRFNPNLMSEASTLLSTRALSSEQCRFEDVKIRYEATTMTAFASGTASTPGLTTPTQGQYACVFDSNIDTPFCALGDQVTLDKIRTHQTKSGGRSTTGVMKNHMWKCPRQNMGDPRWYKIDPTVDPLNSIQTTAYILQTDSPAYVQGNINNWKTGKFWAEGRCYFKEDTIRVLPGAMDMMQSLDGVGWSSSNKGSNLCQATLAAAPTTARSLPCWNGQQTGAGNSTMQGSNLGVGMATVSGVPQNVYMSLPKPGNYLIHIQQQVQTGGACTTSGGGLSGASVIGGGGVNTILTPAPFLTGATYTAGHYTSDGYYVGTTVPNAILVFTVTPDPVGLTLAGGAFAFQVIFISPGFSNGPIYNFLQSTFNPDLKRVKEEQQISSNIDSAMKKMEERLDGMMKARMLEYKSPLSSMSGVVPREETKGSSASGIQREENETTRIELRGIEKAEDEILTRLREHGWIDIKRPLPTKTSSLKS